MFPVRHPAAKWIRRALQQNCTVQLLNQHLFETIDEMRDFTTKWLWTYNDERPNVRGAAK